jgi:peptidoglycan/LPS O-acetylase OafA/YrhL
LIDSVLGSIPAAEVADDQGSALAASESRERFYLPELDTLRFFAFLCVFLFHLRFSFAWQPWMIVENLLVRRILSMGAFGVDLFFTLSAYLITKLLLRERATSGKIHVLYFYTRRALRIWPLYFFFLTFGSVLVYVNPVFRYTAVEPAYLLLLAIFIGNFAPSNWMWSAFVMSNLWTVSVEEQFYLFWPRAIREASIHRIRVIASGLLLIASLARGAAYLAGVSQLWMWTCTFTHLDPFAVGILLGTIPYATAVGLCTNRRLCFLLTAFVAWGLAAYFGIARLPRHLGDSHLGLLLKYPFAAVGSGAFLLATLGTSEAGSRFTTNLWLVYLGKISYGLYVYHSFAMIFTSHYLFRVFLDRFKDPPFWVGWFVYIALSFSLTVLMAAISYKCLESPFLLLKRRFTYIESRPV